MTPLGLVHQIKTVHPRRLNHIWGTINLTPTPSINKISLKCTIKPLNLQKYILFR
jgi:hypothetical protein